MKIGVFGTGVVGQVIAEKLESLGHDVMIGTRDVQQSMAREAKDNSGRPALNALSSTGASAASDRRPRPSGAIAPCRRTTFTRGVRRSTRSIRGRLLLMDPM